MPEYNLCRICLTEDMDSDSMHPLFIESDAACKELVRKIEECGGIRLQPLDDIPSMLCFRCMDSLMVAYKFRELCQASENAFLNAIVKTEVKAEFIDNVTVQDDNDDALIFDMGAEYIDGEEIEMTNITESAVDDVLDEDEILEEHIQYEEEDDDDDDDGDGDADADSARAQDPEVDVDADGDGNVERDDDEESDEYMCLANSSDSEYQPKEKIKPVKSRLKKTKHGKRGRPRIHVQTKSLEDNEEPHRARGRRSEDDGCGTSIMCEICGNIYTKRGALNMHMRRHMAEKPFACEICGKTFAGPSELNRHIRVHTGEKPFTCKFCNRSFADRSSNIRHERTHTNERPFSCMTCGKAFAYSNVLKNHMLTHTGEKPFLCLPCNKTFSRKHQLDQHLATITHQATVKTHSICAAKKINIECIDE